MIIRSRTNLLVAVISAVAVIQNLSDGVYFWAAVCGLGGLVNLHYAITWVDEK